MFFGETYEVYEMSIWEGYLVFKISVFAIDLSAILGEGLVHILVNLKQNKGLVGKCKPVTLF